MASTKVKEIRKNLSQTARATEKTLKLFSHHETLNDFRVMAICVVDVYPRWECGKDGKTKRISKPRKKAESTSYRHGGLWTRISSSKFLWQRSLFVLTGAVLFQTILVQVRFGTSLWFPIPQWHDRKDMQISSTKLFPSSSSAAGNFIPKIRRDIFKELSLAEFRLTSWHSFMQIKEPWSFKIHSTSRAQRPRTCFITLSMRLWHVVRRQSMHV